MKVTSRQIVACGLILVCGLLVFVPETLFAGEDSPTDPIDDPNQPDRESCYAGCLSRATSSCEGCAVMMCLGGFGCEEDINLTLASCYANCRSGVGTNNEPFPGGGDFVNCGGCLDGLTFLVESLLS